MATVCPDHFDFWLTGFASGVAATVVAAAIGWWTAGRRNQA